ncbi:hypothetical protein JTB14_029324 [Gonioctena quinquepunctata]|nr:hypothetical protein JTB14_029324 [Gonioctena quinquepunctata]
MVDKIPEVDRQIRRVQFSLKVSKARAVGSPPIDRNSPILDETDPYTSGVEPAGGETTTSADKGSGRAPNQGGNTALKRITPTLRKETLVCNLGKERPAPDREAEHPNRERGANVCS